VQIKSVSHNGMELMELNEGRNPFGLEVMRKAVYSNDVN